MQYGRDISQKVKTSTFQSLCGSHCICTYFEHVHVCVSVSDSALAKKRCVYNMY